MGLFYVRVDVRSHVNNGPLNNLCIVCMWRCIVSWCSLISPCEWCGSWKWVTVSLVMAMARRTWSVATGLARDTLGENLTCPTPSKDCFFGLVSYVVSYVVFGCFYLPPERFRTENERFRGIPPEKGMKNLRKNSRNNPCKGFWTVQNGSERRMNGSGVFPPEKGMMGFNYGFILACYGPCLSHDLLRGLRRGLRHGLLHAWRWGYADHRHRGQ